MEQGKLESKVLKLLMKVHGARVVFTTWEINYETPIRLLTEEELKSPCGRPTDVQLIYGVVHNFDYDNEKPFLYSGFNPAICTENELIELYRVRYGWNTVKARLALDRDCQTLVDYEGGVRPYIVVGMR